MLSIMSDAAEELHRALTSIRSKYLLAREARLEREKKGEELFQPITARLDHSRPQDLYNAKEENNDKAANEENNDKAMPERQNAVGDPVQKRIIVKKTSIPEQRPSQMRKTNDESYGYRTAYTVNSGDPYHGLYREGQKWYLGDSQVKFLPGDKIQIGDHKFKGSTGLYELLFRKEPRHYNSEDEKTYADMLLYTNALYKDNNPSSGLYKDAVEGKSGIISDLFSGLGIRRGSGLFKVEDGRLPSLTYWDDPNELVDRLRLLIASQQAGNTSHTNEIISILEELREAGYIQ